GEIVPPGLYSIEIEAGRYDTMPHATASGLSTMSITSSSTPSGMIRNWLETWSYNIKVKGVDYSDLTTSLTASPESLVADGASLSTITVTVKKPDTSPMSGAILLFDPPTKGSFTSDRRVVTDARGEAKIVFKAGTEGGEETIRARLGYGAGSQSLNVPINLLKIESFTITPLKDGDGTNDLYNENFYPGLGRRKIEVEIKDESGNPLTGWPIKFSANIAGEFSGLGGITVNVVKTNGAGKANVYYRTTNGVDKAELVITATLEGTSTSVNSGKLTIRRNGSDTISKVEAGQTLLIYDPEHVADSVQDLQEKLNQVVPRKKSVAGYIMVEEEGSYDDNTASAIEKFRLGFGANMTEEDRVFDELKKVYPDLGVGRRGRVLGRQTYALLKEKREDVTRFVAALLREAARYADCNTRWLHIPSEEPNPPANGNPGEAYFYGGGVLLETFVATLEGNRVRPNEITSYDQYETGRQPEKNYFGIDCSGFVQACANVAGAPYFPNLNERKINTDWINNRLNDGKIYRINFSYNKDVRIIPKHLKKGDIIVIPSDHVVIVNENPLNEINVAVQVINAHGITPITSMPGVFGKKVLRMPFAVWYGARDGSQFNYGRLLLWN
ncbi:MAG: hypothetical protein ABIH69_07320, partial [bacterium]